MWWYRLDSERAVAICRVQNTKIHNTTVLGDTRGNAVERWGQECGMLEVRDTYRVCHARSGGTGGVETWWVIGKDQVTHDRTRIVATQ